MNARVIENHCETGLNLAGIAKRIIKYMPEWTVNGVNEIVIPDASEEEDCFGAYDRKVRRIELHAGDSIGWVPWILKKTYLIPYILIGQALGHETDHHVNRQNPCGEKATETTALKYVYRIFRYP
jgi:hypothetical protein